MKNHVPHPTEKLLESCQIFKMKLFTKIATIMEIFGTGLIHHKSDSYSVRHSDVRGWGRYY